jgi:nitronate monooxygenase
MPEMVAAISKGVGSVLLLLMVYLPAKTVELIQRTKALTAQHFAVNLFANSLPGKKYRYLSSEGFRAKFADAGNEIKFTIFSLVGLEFHSYIEQIEILRKRNIPKHTDIMIGIIK